MLRILSIPPKLNDNTSLVSYKVRVYQYLFELLWFEENLAARIGWSFPRGAVLAPVAISSKNKKISSHLLYVGGH